MESTLKNWGELLSPKSLDDRASITKDDLEAAHRGFVTTSRELLDREIAVLAVEAQQEADAYWAAHRSACEDGEQGRVGTRVRIIGTSLTAVWYRNRFVDQGAGEKKRVFSTHIKKGVGDGYSMAHFKGEPDWARYMIKSVESKYVVLRRRAAALGKVRRALAEYERLLASDGGIDQGGGDEP